MPLSTDRDKVKRKRDERIQIVVPDHAPWPPKGPEPQPEPDQRPFEEQPERREERT